VTAFWVGALASIATSALVNEFCDLSPWLAHRLARWAAHVWARRDANMARTYEEEWGALVHDCPGKLSKLMLAIGFLASAAGSTLAERLQRFNPPTSSFIRQLSDRWEKVVDSDFPIASTVAGSILPIAFTVVGFESGKFVTSSLLITGSMLMGALLVWSDYKDNRTTRREMVDFIDAASIACGTTFIAAFRSIAEDHGACLPPFEIKFRQRPGELGRWWEFLVDLSIPDSIVILRPVGDEFVLLYRNLGRPRTEIMAWDTEAGSFVSVSSISDKWA
jgi:hypothetical protein